MNSIHRTRVFAIDGNIGSGKSVLVRHFENYVTSEANVKSCYVFLQEPVDDWNSIMDKDGTTILENFYKDQAKWSFSFQMMAYISRLAQVRKAVRENPGAIIIVERSIFTDRWVFAKMLYDDKKINEIDYSIYMKWFDEFADDIDLDGEIYLKTSPVVAHGRVIKRSRKGEEIPIEYLNKCHLYHEEWLNETSKDGMSMHIIDGDVDIEMISINNRIKEIISYIDGNHS
jgi:deoxyadenosine/deoxycytidine kinase